MGVLKAYLKEVHIYGLDLQKHINVIGIFWTSGEGQMARPLTQYSITKLGKLLFPPPKWNEATKRYNSI
jgi:hypothetical protein